MYGILKCSRSIVCRFKYLNTNRRCNPRYTLSALDFSFSVPRFILQEPTRNIDEVQNKKVFFFLLNWTDKNLPAHGFKCIDRLYVEQPDVHCTLLYVYFALLYDT